MARLRSEIALGAQIAVCSRVTRLRSALTAVGVAAGVALLLLAASVPHAVSAHNARNDARQPDYAGRHAPLRVQQSASRFHSTDISGVTLQVTGAQPPVPPGISRIPGPGQMDVSPALATMLRGPDGAELRARLQARVVGTIGKAGLSGPGDVRFYRGAAHLSAADGASGVRSFGGEPGASDGGPIITLLVIVMVVALLLPVGVFVATAARFGAEDRDRRLAALRLVGADTLSTSRIAASESLVGALVGLGLGALVYLAYRPLAPHVSIAGVGVFQSDVQPSVALAALVAVLVPLSAVAATLLGIRRVAIEPLGVSRRGSVRHRRLGWRLVFPVLGFLLLVPLLGAGSRLSGTGGQIEASAGVVLALVGLTALLPWVVEGIVRRAPDGPLPWLLAIRRLRGDEGTTGRVVAAIGLAAAGAIALQILFAAADRESARQVGPQPDRGALIVSMASPSTDGGAAQAAGLRKLPGVSAASAVATALGGDDLEVATVAPCEGLALVADLGRCRDGNSFVMREPGTGLRPGGTIRVSAHRMIRIPAGARRVQQRVQTDLPSTQLLLTPAAAARLDLRGTSVTAIVSTTPGDAAAADRVRDHAAAVDPYAEVTTLGATDHKLLSLRHALFAGAVAVLLMIGASLLVAVGEQLRERRRTLAVLAAVGTRRSTMAWSMLWQAAIPVVTGLVLATALGIALGNVLTAIVNLNPSYDWGAMALMAGAGAAVIAAVTLLTLPTLWRLMRPQALRVE